MLLTPVACPGAVESLSLAVVAGDADGRKISLNDHLLLDSTRSPRLSGESRRRRTFARRPSRPFGSAGELVEPVVQEGGLGGAQGE
ncbi:hypothetical protein, partial [Frankia gtarii]|uniref:hypothetical protein n=1 Tax=Frankia gtarii TaxID=2950102 RepID=UPI0021C1E871